MSEAMGFIETWGLVASVEAADAMCKAAHVRLYACENYGSGRCTIIVVGDVGAVTSAVQSGAKAAEKVGELYTSLVMPRPHEDIRKIVKIHQLKSSK